MALFHSSLNPAADPLVDVAFVSLTLFSFVITIFVLAILRPSTPSLASVTPTSARTLKAYLTFFWTCFLKPHSGDSTRRQQDALESFYKTQAAVYDATRARLLHGREDMLGLVAAQLKFKADAGMFKRRPIWVDVGGGTGWNIEQMGRFLSVPEFFRAVYLVDLSPSLCEIAKARFARLGWKNVYVVCEDARAFRLEDHETFSRTSSPASSPTQQIFDLEKKSNSNAAELITLSYALSMIPDYYPVIDSVTNLLSPIGIFGVTDFYVQSQVEYQSRNYTGGVIDRHCMWISRVFWRTWFEIDRVNLDAARRDYLEYRFGTVLNINGRNHMFGIRIPYYIWIGSSKAAGSCAAKLAELDAAATESPFLSALDLQAKTVRNNANQIDVRSKAYESAIVNLASSLPLPASWYQNHHWRIYYDDQLPKHKQFNDEYIYAFTWEDSRVDSRLLKIQPHDVILSITSAGDNILSFALEQPRRIHAVDLNPSQNHLLELKMAAFQALGYSDVWKLFGEGKHERFRNLLVNKLSPHLSSLAFQYWLHHGSKAFERDGLYLTGGSRHALKLVAWLFRVLGMSAEIERLYTAATLNEQREIWQRSVRRVLLSRTLSWLVIGNEAWLWKALGVPPAQRALIEQDYVRLASDHEASAGPANARARQRPSWTRSGHAIWEYVVNTLDPVVSSTLLSDDNHYYLLTLRRAYTRRCHPAYLTPRAHIKLSAPGAFDGLRIHTDEMREVLARMSPGTLTIAVVMDSMDWFDSKNDEARGQIRNLNRALADGGRVLLRSAGLEPWYLKVFVENAFKIKCVGRRVPGTCSDRVNMYASTWICTKTGPLEFEDQGDKLKKTYGSMEKLSI
ncbi:hypothetical protein BDY21DRAFT_285297 [Lineolata rhizophorae]|uniref:Betaine lipid synthase n=1 Tax=Lineolata rhizophorae TaxID=578093 RepID=A0A6A6P3B8_9PEZI|nr:hypothetical protein BDY21DRAFT_285297 [Lineolata rhizophorae]